MQFSKLLSNGALILACCLVANFSYAQQKQEQRKEAAPKKIIVIKKSEDGKVKTEKIITEGDQIHELELNGGKEKVIIQEVETEGQSHRFNVFVEPDDMELEVEQNVEVEIENIDGEKHLKVRVQPMDGDAKTFEWKGEGEIPVEIREKMEADGIFIQEVGEGHEDINVFSIDQDDMGNFQWHGMAEADGPFLGVVSAVEKTVEIEIDENGGEQKTESRPEVVDGVLVGEVVEGSAAQKAGLLKGDILKSIDGNTLGDFSDLVDFMQSAEVGQRVSISYERDGRLDQTEATLEEREVEMPHNVIIERIHEDGEHMDEDGNVFFFRTEDNDQAKIHTRHKIVVITRGDEKDDAKEASGISDMTLPETPLQRDLDLQDYQLFPNPADGNVRLRFKAGALPTVVKISDLNGKQMFRERLNRFDGAYDEQIDLQDLPAGTYSLTIEQAGKVYTELLIVN